MPALWPYVPLPDILETIQFNTDVLKSASTEMRYSIRGGRQSFEYVYPRSEAFQEMEALFRSDPYGEWYVPVWTQVSRPGAVGSSDTSLSVDINHEWTDKVVIFGGCDDYVIADIDTVTTTVDLTAPVGQAFSDPAVMPVRTCLAPGGAKIARGTKRHTLAEIKWISVDEFGASGSSYATLNSLPFFKCSGAYVRPVSGQLVHPVEMVDQGFQQFDLVTLRDNLEMMKSVSVSMSDSDEKKAFRDFLGDIRGQDGAFWITDWEGKLTLLSNPLSGATTASVSPIFSDVADYVDRYMKIGDDLRLITAASEISATEHELTFSSLSADASTAHLLRKVRMDTDEFKITHRRDLVMSVDFMVAEVTA